MNIITFFRKYPYLKMIGLYFLCILPLIPCIFAIKNKIIPVVPLGMNLITAVKFVVAFIFLYLLCRIKGIPYFLNHWKFNTRQLLAIAIFFVPQLAIIFFTNDFVFSRNSFYGSLHHLSTGFLEEILNRGVFLMGLTYFYIHYGKKKPVGGAILFSGIFFGGSHLINIITTDATLMQSIFQCTGAMVVGFAFCMFTILIRNILPVIVLHWFNNAYNPNWNYAFPLEFCLAFYYFFMILFLLDKKSIENWCEKTKALFIQ